MGGDGNLGVKGVGTLQEVREDRKWDSNLAGTQRHTCRRDGCNIVQKYRGIQKVPRGGRQPT